MILRRYPRIKEFNPDDVICVTGYSKVPTEGTARVHRLLIYFWEREMVVIPYKHRRSCKRAYKRWLAHLMKGEANSRIGRSDSKWKED